MLEAVEEMFASMLGGRGLSLPRYSVIRSMASAGSHAKKQGIMCSQVELTLQ